MGTYSITVGEMASHNHSASASTVGNHTHKYETSFTAVGGAGGSDMRKNFKQYDTGAAGSHSHTITVNNMGSDTAHNNIQPYLAVYYWQRTA